MEGGSDSSIDYFDDSSSEWNGGSKESSYSEGNLSQVEEHNIVLEATNENSMTTGANDDWFEVDCFHLRWSITIYFFRSSWL